tara:strand:+ start:503 stop:676 length:174 start_codon:yes stop_codon:yes gene_type:complete
LVGWGARLTAINVVLIGPSAALVDPMQAMHRAPENSINQRVERRRPERLAGGGSTTA